MDSNSSSSFDTSYAGPMTRGRMKALAEVYSQTTPIPQPSPVSNTSKAKKSQVASFMQGASKDVMGLVKDMLSHPALFQTSESIQEVPIAEEENKSPDGSEFSFSENIPTSKIRDSPRSVSSFAMPIMITNTTSLEV